MILRFVVLMAILFSAFSLKAQTSQEQKEFWKMIAKQIPEYKKIFKKHKKYRFEIIYGQINHEPGKSPQVKKYYFGDKSQYYYPASTVKLPVTLRTLELLNTIEKQHELAHNDWHIQSIDTNICGSYKAKTRTEKYLRITVPISARLAAAKCGLTAEEFLSINHYEPDSIIQPGSLIRTCKSVEANSLREMMNEMLVYSNNNFYNLIFEIGNGISCETEKNAKITTRFMACLGTTDSTGAMVLKHEKSGHLHSKTPERITDLDKRIFETGFDVGKKFIDAQGKTVKKPINFSRHNSLQLEFTLNCIAELIFPGYLPEGSFYDLNEEDRKMTIRYLGMRPEEDGIVTNKDYLTLADNYTNYLFTGQEKTEIPENIRIINIVGQSYGFITDCMYFADEKEKVDFFLAARIYVNKDKTLNDDKYEYNEIAFPLFEKLGKVIYEYEKKREKTVLTNPGWMFQLFR